MKCPHCHKEIHVELESVEIEKDADAIWFLEKATCPACKRLILELSGKKIMKFGQGEFYAGAEIARSSVRPRGSMRPNPSEKVPEKFSQDCIEASLVLSDSPKASSALSRRCLQHILREKAGVKHSNLDREIQEVMDSGKLPSHLENAIDAVRNIGNFAAHPIKSTASGEVIDVEPGEAEWTLDVIEGLFDFYFVQPSLLHEKREALNKKLADAKKPLVK
jgi:hypothetical protein